MRLFLNKKGESLVEVVVSLGIIAMVFAGVMSLLVISISLNLSARQRNNAINLAANRLSNFYIEGDMSTPLDSGVCVIAPPRVTGTPIGDATCPSRTEAQLAADADQVCDYIILNNLDNASNETTSDSLLLTSNFYVKVESHVRYYVRSIGVQEYVVTKLMRIR